ncbi:MAG: hypothetical protein JWM87_815 [Candidatus Eremiobacteraeota bacterium]|nr:hypothetical protein [Candidatus Eremiobacteraeota bacterium]
MTRIVLLLCVFIVALDAVESVISKTTGVPYAWFMIVQIVVYAAIGFVLRRRGLRIERVAVAVAVTSVVEATAGEAVAIAIGASPRMSFAELIVIIPFVVGFETCLGLAGYGIGSIGRARHS